MFSMRLEEAIKKGSIVAMLFFSAAVIEIHGRFLESSTAARHNLGECADDLLFAGSDLGEWRLGAPD